jgi:hypothetical protein
MTILTKDQQDLVSLIRQVGYELTPQTYTNSFGLVGFTVSGGFKFIYNLSRSERKITLGVTLLSQTTQRPVRKLFIGLNYNSIPIFEYGTIPFTNQGEFDDEKSYVKVYKSDIVEEELYELVKSMPKSHAKAFKIALNKIPLYNS